MKKINLFVVLLLLTIASQAQSIRKNYLEMTKQEQDDYVQSLNTMYANGFIPEIAEHHGEHFCSNIHTRNPSYNGENFLPWHRFFLLNFEEHLRQTPTGAYLSIPYWDWRTDPVHPTAASPINILGTPDFWGYSDVAGGAPSFLAKSKFSSWSVASFVACSNTVPASSLTRSYNTSPGMLAVPTDIQNATALTLFFNPAAFSSSATITDFSHRIEFWHNRAHGFVGGTMGSFSSPLDPVFELHHNMIDKLWYDKEEESTGMFSSLPNGTSIMPHYDGMHDPEGNIVVGNASLDSRAIQRPLISGSGRTMDVWYAQNGKVVLDGANGNEFVVNDNTAPYVYRYTAALTPATTNPANIAGTIYVGDVQRDPGNFNNIIADNKGGFRVAAGVSCTFKSGGAIEFLPGFTADFSSVTTAEIITNPAAKPSEVAIENPTVASGTFSCYPNPATTFITLKNTSIQNKQLQIQVFSLEGKLQHAEIKPSFSNECDIDIASLIPGIYFIRIITDQVKETIKFRKL
jgi:tyrosinase